MRINKYGLSRDIDEPTKREIRQRCGFWCVNCWCYIYEYEHIEPTFENAKKHEANKITLLCWSCHNYVTRRIWSKDQIKELNKNPKCLQEWFSNGILWHSPICPIIYLWNNVFINTFNIITINNKSILKIEPPRQKWESFLLSASFYNDEWIEVLVIKKNEIKIKNDNWDIETSWNTLKIRKWKWNFTLIIKNEWWEKIYIEQIDMTCNWNRIFWNIKNTFSFETINGTSWILMWITYDWWWNLGWIKINRGRLTM